MTREAPMDVFERAKNICFNPKNTWQQILIEPTTIRELFVTYACILALVPSMANLIGTSFVGSTSMGMRYRVPFFSGLVYAAASYLFSLLSIYVIALVIDALAPRFASEKNLLNAVKLSVYSATPSWVGSILLILPGLAVISILISLYGFYLLYLGLPVLMGTPRERLTPYFAAVVFVTIIVTAFIGAVGALLFAPVMVGNL
jgi:hypothetical protein